MAMRSGLARLVLSLHKTEAGVWLQHWQWHMMTNATAEGSTLLPTKLSEYVPPLLLLEKYLTPRGHKCRRSEDSARHQGARIVIEGAGA